MQAFLDLKGKTLLPIHWAKFSLSLHGWTEPVQRLRQAATLHPAAVLTPRIGQVIQVGVDLVQEAWWEE